jgi:hypothetical protein
MRNSGNQGSRTKLERTELDHDVDALFRLPLAEFTEARNTLAVRLKKSGRGDDAVVVKALAKPAVSAWAVNQLYWNHREAFDRLIASGERFHKQTSAATVGDMRTALNARREVLTHLTDLATSLLRDAGQNPAPDTIHRITTTLEAMSAMSNWASRSDGPLPGRLSKDVDPPGFDSLASWMPAGGMTQPTEQRQEAGHRRQTTGTTGPATPKAIPFAQKSSSGRSTTQQKVKTDGEVRRIEEQRKAKIAAAKVSLQDAKRSLTKARARAFHLEATRKTADAEAKKAEKQKQDVEERLEKAKAALEDATRRARSVAVELEEAASEVDDAERIVEKASKELESLFGE